MPPSAWAQLCSSQLVLNCRLKDVGWHIANGANRSPGTSKFQHKLNCRCLCSQFCRGILFVDVTVARTLLILCLCIDSKQWTKLHDMFVMGLQCQSSIWMHDMKPFSKNVSSSPGFSMHCMEMSQNLRSSSENFPKMKLRRPATNRSSTWIITMHELSFDLSTHGYGACSSRSKRSFKNFVMALYQSNLPSLCPNTRLSAKLLLLPLASVVWTKVGHSIQTCKNHVHILSLTRFQERQWAQCGIWYSHLHVRKGFHVRAPTKETRATKRDLHSQIGSSFELCFSRHVLTKRVDNKLIIIKLLSRTVQTCPNRHCQTEIAQRHPHVRRVPGVEVTWFMCCCLGDSDKPWRLWRSFICAVHGVIWWCNRLFITSAQLFRISLSFQVLWFRPFVALCSEASGNVGCESAGARSICPAWAGGSGSTSGFSCAYFFTWTASTSIIGIPTGIGGERCLL